MIQADETIDGGPGGGGGGGYVAPVNTAQPRGNTPTGGGTRVGGHTVGGSSGGAAGTPSDTQTVSQAYLAALAAMGKNTSGDTSPYVIMSPGAGTGSGSSIGLGTVLVVAALAAGAWWFYKHRQGA